MNTYKKLQIMCEKKGIALSTLAFNVGISPSCIWRLKDEKNHLTIPTAQKIANYLQIPVEDILTDRKVDETRDELFEKRKVLFDLSSKCSEEDLERFIKIMNALVGE